MRRATLTEYLHNFLRHGADIAYVQHRGYRTVRWSYRQVAETAFQLARELEHRRVEPGDRVLIWGDNCAEWVAAFFGCVLRGAVVVPMDRIAAPDFVHRVAEQVNARLILCSRPLARGGLRPELLLDDLQETLARHNERDWFQAHKPTYDQLRAAFEQDVAYWLRELAKEEPALAGLDPKKCIFRIYRDRKSVV